MKIGLLTLTPTANYGGILQSVALYSYLESLGHEVILVNKTYALPKWKSSAIKLLSIIPFQNIKGFRKLHKKSIFIKPFINKYIPKVSRGIVSLLDLKLFVEEYKLDAVVVGSDQVWRYQYINDGYYSAYFLDFKVNFPVKKIAYAASFGKDFWEAPSEIENVQRCINDFDAVSVREKTGVSLCRDVFNFKGSENVLDPTLLVGKDFYNRFISSTGFCFRRNTIVEYILDAGVDKSNIVSFVTDKIYNKSCDLVRLAEHNRGRFYSVEEWLYSIKNAEFVVTDSFHGMIFSVLFEKQFLVIGNPSRGLSRFTDFLSLVGLENRLLSQTELNKVENALRDPIDYSIVTDNISKIRVFSRDFLLNALGN